MFDLTDKQVARSLKQLKRQRDLINAHQTKARSIALRKEWIEHQNILNYQMEYDRIVGHINSGRPPGVANNLLQFWIKPRLFSLIMMLIIELPKYFAFISF